jgi:Fn3 associated
MKRRRLPILVTALIAATAASALAYWTATSSPGSTGEAAAATVNQGATPSAGVSSVGREVSVNWGASTLSNGATVAGYLVKRYPAGGGAATVSPIGTCTGTVAGVTCLEDDTPSGTWRYTVTPVIGAWHGAESALSGVVTVSAATLGVNGSPFGDATFTPAFANTTGSITGFSGTGSGGNGEGVTYRLDSATPLSGSPAFVGTDGNASITSLDIPKSAGDGAHTVYALGDAAYFPTQASTAIVIDTMAPSVTAQLSPTPNAAGWNNTSPVAVTLSADDGTGSGVARIKYTTDGSDPVTSGTAQVYSGSPFDVAAEGATTVKYFAQDVAGNASAVQTQPVKIDLTAPTNGLSVTNVSGGLYPTTGPLANGATVYYRGTAAGSFTVRNALADALSGPAESATSALTGSTGGWSHAPSQVTTPAGGPYVSATFSWGSGTSSSPSETVTGRDVADNLASTTLNFTDDSTGPSGGSVNATGLGGTGSRYSTSTSLSLFLDRGADSGSGLAATGAKLLRASAPLSSDGTSDGVCGSYGGFAQVGSDDPSSPFTDNAAGGISTGHCYQYEYVVPDNVGNTTTYVSPDIKVDTSGPVGPSVSLSGASGNTFVSGGTVYINAQAGRSGGFQVGAATTDGDSGILKVNFPAASGFTSGGGDVSGSPFQSGYSWSGAVGASGAQTVTAHNNAGLTSTSSFTITPDTSNPTGGALTVNGTAATGAGSSSYNSGGSWTIGAIGDYTDSGSGLASSTLTRQSATLSSSDGVAAGVCGGFGAATTISSRATPIAQALGGPNCYLYTLTGIDNVGNTVSISTTVKVDTSGPVGPSVSLSGASGNTFVSGGTVYINAQAGNSGSFQATATSSDGDSGIQKINFPALSGFSSGGGDDTSSPFSSGTYSWSGAVGASGEQTVTAHNNAGLTSTSSFTITPDTSNPTGGALTVNGTAATGAGTSSTTTNPGFAINSRTDYTDGGSGISSSRLTIQSATMTNNSTCGAPGSGGPFTTATTISGTTNVAITVGYCYVYTLTGMDNVGNSTSISTTVKVQFAGIDWTGITTSGGTVSCNYTTITAVACSVTGVGSGGTFTARVTLIDANHTAVSNTTGSAITVSQSTTGKGSSSPATVSIAQSATGSAAAFTLTLQTGASKAATITASITVNGTTYTVNCQVNT